MAKGDIRVAWEKVLTEITPPAFVLLGRFTDVKKGGSYRYKGLLSGNCFFNHCEVGFFGLYFSGELEEFRHMEYTPYSSSSTYSTNYYFDITYDYSSIALLDNNRNSLNLSDVDEYLNSLSVVKFLKEIRGSISSCPLWVCPPLRSSPSPPLAYGYALYFYRMVEINIFPPSIDF
jgi:hypothetical protein